MFYDLKKQIETDLCNELAELLAPFQNVKDMDSYQLFYNMFSYTKKHAAIFNALLGPNGDISFLTYLNTVFKQYYLSPFMEGQPITYTRNIEYAYNFISAGFTGLVTSWLADDNDCSIEEMAKLTSKMVFDGLPALLQE